MAVGIRVSLKTRAPLTLLGMLKVVKLDQRVAVLKRLEASEEGRGLPRRVSAPSIACRRFWSSEETRA